jgi:hypothetical protein
MIQPRQTTDPSSRGRGVRPVRSAIVIGTTVLAAVIAFAVLRSIVGLVAFGVKLVIVLAIAAFVVRLVTRRGNRSGR